MAIQPDHILLWRQGSNIKGEHQASLCSKSGARACASVVLPGFAGSRGTRVDVVDQQEESTEIVIRGKHWFTDE
jgi:hypothetical protein